jgi:glycosyltransferase involved in cell wall biosynthesis
MRHRSTGVNVMQVPPAGADWRPLTEGAAGHLSDMLQPGPGYDHDSPGSSRVEENLVRAMGTPSGHERVLVTIPVHNEADRLYDAIEALDKAFRGSTLNYRLSVAEDGSTDGTKDLLRRLPERWPGILVQEEASPLGRGRALRELWSRAAADVYCFTDADLAAGPEAVVHAAQKVVEGTPVVIGSRYTEGACTTRPPFRSFVSRGYNLLLRFSFGEGIRDHQCGVKAFSSDAIRLLLPLTQEDSWFWDTEIVVLALVAGLSILEFPVRWVERKTARTGMTRLLSDLVLHGTGVMRLKSRVRVGLPGRGSRRSTQAHLPAVSGIPVSGRGLPGSLRR